MRKINEVIIHCTATRPDQDVHASDIDRWHREQGWNSIGYHYVIALDGKIEKGRDVALIGAHCKQHNLYSIGVAYVGGLDKFGRPADTRTEAQKSAMLDLCRMLKETYKIETFTGHSTYAKKYCPCFDVRKWAYANELMHYHTADGEKILC